MSFDTLLAEIPNIGFLAELSDQDREDFFAMGVMQRFGVGETVIWQGKQQKTLYLVLDGALKARCHSESSVVELGMFVEGDCFGEMSLLDPLKASATIKATEAGVLWKIERCRFQEFLSDHPQAGIKLLTHFGIQLSRRMRRMDDQFLRYQQRPAGFDYDY